jgi:hypothetical protein
MNLTPQMDTDVPSNPPPNAHSKSHSKNHFVWVVCVPHKEIIEPDNSYLEMSVFSLQPIIDNFFLVCVRAM